MRTTEDILSPPTATDVERALALFARAVEHAYGDRLVSLFLFGSRARGDHEPFSDADVAVVLSDDDWSLVSEKRRLGRIAHDPLVETGVAVQGWPVSRKAWDEPALHSNPALVANMRRDAKRISGFA